MADSITIEPFGPGYTTECMNIFRQAYESLAVPDWAKTYRALYIDDGLTREYPRIEEVYAGSGGGFWLAMIGPLVVGTIGFRANTGLQGLEIRRLCVRPDYFKQGIARRLMAHAEAVSRKKGCSRLYLQTSQFNEAALEMYNNLGFETVRSVKKQLGEANFTVIDLEKQISP